MAGNFPSLSILWSPLFLFPAITSAVILYLWFLNCAMKRVPKEALARSPNRFTTEQIQQAASQQEKSPINVDAYLPRKTGNLYIVVGGSGFLGGWIVVQLLQRGEDPRRIRIVDIRRPSRTDLTTGNAKDVTCIQADITNPQSVMAAFDAPWPPNDLPKGAAHPKITVFHTASNIRFYERHPLTLPLSASVNIVGTQNVIDAARSVGANALIYTSSGSIAIHNSRFWLWPWESVPQPFIHSLDDKSPLPTRHEEFWSNYAVTKTAAETLIRRADKSATSRKDKLRLRTGCIRPGNGVFGPGGDILAGAYLVRKVNPTWIADILQSFIYVENAAIAHLQYERSLLDLDEAPDANGGHDIGGDSFCITDPNPPISWNDLYLALGTLTNGVTTFPRLPPIVILILAHMLELYCNLRIFLLGAPLPGKPSSENASFLAKLLPPITGDMMNLQPTLFALTNIHLFFNDSRARLPSSQGGIGYRAPFTTLQGLVKLVAEFKKDGKPEDRQAQPGGGGIGFGLVAAQRGVEKAAEKLGVIDPPT